MEWIAVWIFCGIISAAIASSRGRSGCAWLLLGFLFGPFGFAVALLPRMKEESKENQSLAKCPFCAEHVKAEAVKCKHCGSEIPVSARTILATDRAAAGTNIEKAPTNWIGMAAFVAILLAAIAAFNWIVSFTR